MHQATARPTPRITKWQFLTISLEEEGWWRMYRVVWDRVMVWVWVLPVLKKRWE